MSQESYLGSEELRLVLIACRQRMRLELPDHRWRTGDSGLPELLGLVRSMFDLSSGYIV